MTLGRMPVFAWAMLVVALMIVFAFPAIIAGTDAARARARVRLAVLHRRARRRSAAVAAPVLVLRPPRGLHHLPAGGRPGLDDGAGARRARRWSATARSSPALVAVGVVSFALWAHHMFTAGLGAVRDDAGLGGEPRGRGADRACRCSPGSRRCAAAGCASHAARLFLLGFLFIFVLGGLTGVMVAVLPFDWQVHDTYFIVAHLHYVLIGGMVFPMFAALYHWTPLVNGHALSERRRPLGVRADVRRLQPRVLPDAHRRPARHAAARLHLRRRLGWDLLEPAVDGRRLRARGRRRAVLRRRDRGPGCARRARARQPVAAPARSSGCRPATTARAASRRSTRASRCGTGRRSPTKSRPARTGCPAP